MKRLPRQQVKTGLVYFTQLEYARLLAVAADSNELEATWEEWLQTREKTKFNLALAGIAVVDVPVEVDELLKYCLLKNVPLDSNARAGYVAEKMRRADTGE
jgi:hypothetical protein